MDRKKMLMIVNPKAGKMRVKSHIIDIINRFCSVGYGVTVETTQCAGDAVRIASGVNAEYDRVVCCGGDGTLNETISGMLKSGNNIPIGYIPCGTTNDMATSLGLPKTVMKAADVVLEGVPMPHDIGQIDADRYFTYITAFGIFTHASYATSQTLKNKFGHFAYVLDGAKELLGNMKKYHTRVIIDGECFEDEYIYGSVSNSISFAGLFKFPEEKINLADGKFEVLLIKKPTNPKALTDLYFSLKKRRFNDKNILFKSASSVSFETDDKLTWTIDGECGSETNSINIENLKEKVSIIR